MNNDNKIINKIKSLKPLKQGVLIIVLSLTLFFSMLAIDGSSRWGSKYAGNTMMTVWSIISTIGIAVALLRIFVFNGNDDQKKLQ